MIFYRFYTSWGSTLSKVITILLIFYIYYNLFDVKAEIKPQQLI
jgi:hypothetical protein